MTPAADLTTLNDVLGYRHAGVVARYAKEQGTSREDAEEIFVETLKWLYLCYRNADTTGNASLAMLPDLAKLDEMWHTFIIFTRDYSSFCETYFRTYIHHLPITDEDDQIPPDEGTERARLEQQFALVHDILGEETLLRWHDECRYSVAS